RAPGVPAAAPGRRPPPPAAPRRPAITARSAAARAIRASVATASPASVGLMPRGSLSITGVPSSRSIAAIWCDNAGCDMCRVAAAFVSEPRSTMATRHSSALMEIMSPFLSLRSASPLVASGGGPFGHRSEPGCRQDDRATYDSDDLLKSSPGCGRCEQAQGAGGLDRLGPAVGAELGVQVAQVGLDGAGRDRQLAG